MADTAPWGTLDGDKADPNYGRECGRCGGPVRQGMRYAHVCVARTISPEPAEVAEADLRAHLLKVYDLHLTKVDELTTQVARARAETQEACALALETESRSDAGVRGAALREAAAIVRAMGR